MNNNPFQNRAPNITGNHRLRTPQREAYAEMARFAADPGEQEREIGIVLPVGCGKSGCITLTPFAFRAGRTLVIAPSVPIAQQLRDDFDPARPLKILQDKGYTSDQVKQAYEELQPVPVTKVRQRQAMRAGLDMRVKTEAARILHERKINPEGHELDRQRLGRTNLIVMKAAIDRHVNTAIGRETGERSDFTRPQLDQIERDFVAIVELAIQEVFNAKN